MVPEVLATWARVSPKEVIRVVGHVLVGSLVKSDKDTSYPQPEALNYTLVARVCQPEPQECVCFYKVGLACSWVALVAFVLGALFSRCFVNNGSGPVRRRGGGVVVYPGAR